MRFVCSILVMLVLAVGSVYAQFSPPAYDPSQCLTAAKASIAGATDAEVLGVVAVGLELPLGGTSIELAMSSKDGRAPMWLYIVRSKSKDTTVFAPFIRLFFTCSAPPIPADVNLADPSLFEGIGQIPLPGKFTEGPALVTALKSNSKFSAFNTAFPDSNATFSVLTSAVESVPGLFEMGKFYWIINWSSSGLAGGVGEPGSGLLCINDLASGQTICLDSSDFTSVRSYEQDVRFSVAPNPTSDVSVLTMPTSFLGTQVDIDIVSTTGAVMPLARRRFVEAPALVLELGTMPQGMYSLVVRSADRNFLLPLSIVR
ncbi:MAG: hypothetical protein FGM33_03275 [Candidatus Kapabacteria bacterium]|nr:hypothetical protein [Candidatus Kapabacteria bacterium]